MELARRYSNRPDRLDDLNRVMVELDRERGVDATPDSSLVMSTGRRDFRRLRITVRLTAEDRQMLIACYRCGATVRALAERFGLGATSVKRILRDNKARRKDQRRSTP